MQVHGSELYCRRRVVDALTRKSCQNGQLLLSIASSVPHDYTYFIASLIMPRTDTLYGNRCKP